MPSIVMSKREFISKLIKTDDEEQTVVIHQEMSKTGLLVIRSWFTFVLIHLIYRIVLLKAKFFVTNIENVIDWFICLWTIIIGIKLCQDMRT